MSEMIQKALSHEATKLAKFTSMTKAPGQRSTEISKFYFFKLLSYLRQQH